LGVSNTELHDANRQSIAFIAGLRDQFSSTCKEIVLNGIIGPRGDAYAPDSKVAVADAEAYHSIQIGWLAKTEVDMVTATTFTQANEAIGLVRAAQEAGLPVVVSFTVETDGRLPDGQTLSEAILAVDKATQSAAAYFMVNCAHPDHFFDEIEDSFWARRIRGIRCNASRKSHAELDQSNHLDDGDPVELASQYSTLAKTMPWLNIFGGCCGSDLRHVTQIARALVP
jgi:homocysteine S-methyltransferase